MQLEDVPGLRTSWNLNELAGRANYWTTLEERSPTVVIGSIPQLAKSAVKRLKPVDLKRLEREGLAHLTFCVSVCRCQSGRILARTSMARVIMVMQSVVHLGRHDSDPMRDCAWLGVLRVAEREAVGKNDRARDEQDG